MSESFDAGLGIRAGAVDGAARVHLPVVPELIDAENSAGWTTALPALGGLGSIAFIAAGPRSAITYVAGGLFLVMSLAMVVGSLLRTRQSARHGVDHVRRDYLMELAACRARLSEETEARRRRLLHRHPPTDQLWLPGGAAGSHAGEPDDLDVRVGGGIRSVGLDIVLDRTTLNERTDPVCLDAAERFVTAWSTVPGIPITIDFTQTRTVRMTGSGRRELTRSLILQAARRDPDRLTLTVVADDPKEWAWVRWLPHAHGPQGLRLHERRSDVATDVLAQHHLVVTDHPLAPDDPLRSGRCTVVSMTDDLHAADVVIESAGGGLTIDGQWAGLAEACSVDMADLVARSLAGETDSTSHTAARLGNFLHLVGLTGTDPAALAEAREGATHLVGPLGYASDGTPMQINVNESAYGGIGPHGLLIGATGSGKSQLLRTFVVGLATTHRSDRLNFILVDFKGGATFAGFDELPHTAAMITNLESDNWLVARMRAAIGAEIDRRQQRLADAGFNAQADLEASRRRGADLEAMPSLLIVVDEFSELLAQHPDFIDLFTQIGRLGRSLGIHLLLASQRLDEGRLRGLESHLSYRIALRTFSVSESRVVLGTDQAFTLPTEPGHGFLKSDAGPPRRFRAAHAGASMPPPQRVRQHTLVRRLDARPEDRAIAHPPTPGPERAIVGPDLATELIWVLNPLGDRARQIWLPPLGTTVDLASLVSGGAGGLTVPIGIIDQPTKQRVSRYILDLAGAGGHVVVVGAPRSGKTTTMRTIAAALASTHTCELVQIYALDLVGGLGELQTIPHVGSVVARGDREGVVATLQLLRRTIEEREKIFRRAAIDLRQFRALHRANPTAARGADIFLLLDGIDAFRADYDDAEPLLQFIAARGLNFGVHLVISASRWMDVRPALRDLLGTRVELRLADPIDSVIDRHAAAAVPIDRPGRALTDSGEHALIAQASAITSAGAKTPPVPRLPREITPAGLPQSARDAGLCLGVEGERMHVVLADRSVPLQIVLGDSGSGRTSHLRAIAAQLVGRESPERAKVVLVDHRRSMLGEFDGPHLLGYAGTSGQLSEIVTGLCEGLRRRLPPESVTPQQLRDHSWWEGPDIHVLVDDLDLTPSGTEILLPLLKFLPHARDIGLRLSVVRRCAGSARALHGPLLSAMRELGAAVTVLSGSPEEGIVCGVRPAPQPVGRGTLVDPVRGTRAIQLITARG